MLQLRRPALVSVGRVRQDARRFQVVDEEVGAQTVRGDDGRGVRFVMGVLLLLLRRIAFLVCLWEEGLGVGVLVGGGGGGGVGVVGGCVDGHDDVWWCGKRMVGIRCVADRSAVTMSFDRVN